MDISANQYSEIRKLNVNEHYVDCAYSYWIQEFESCAPISNQISQIQEILGGRFNRADVVALYRKKDIDIKTKFLAAMIWGHEAPEGSRRDTRGPWKVRMMLESDNISETLRSVGIGTSDEVLRSYSKMKKNIDRCGPSFLTKHLYFLGKSNGNSSYPLIFDDRVATGLVRLSLDNSRCLDVVSIHAAAKKTAYAKYLEFAERQASAISCDLDMIEYYLFRIGG